MTFRNLYQLMLLDLVISCYYNLKRLASSGTSLLYGYTVLPLTSKVSVQFRYQASVLYKKLHFEYNLELDILFCFILLISLLKIRQEQQVQLPSP